MKKVKAENENLQELSITEMLLAKIDEDRKIMLDLDDELKRKNTFLDEIEEICKKYWDDSGITIDYFKKNNYLWKQHQAGIITSKFESLISRFEHILQKIKEVRGEE